MHENDDSSHYNKGKTKQKMHKIKQLTWETDWKINILPFLLYDAHYMKLDWGRKFSHCQFSQGG